MATELRTEGEAIALLNERAARQALVDRLVGDSVWSRFASGFLPAIALCILFVLTSEAPALVIGALGGLLSLAVGVAQLSMRMHALTEILQRSGALADFVASAGAKARVR